MKKYIIFLASCILFSAVSLAQKKEKVKGDKEVISTSNEIIGEFNHLEISDNLEVEIQTSNRNSYVLTTDQNLAEEVEVRVSNGVLKVYTRSKIVKNKKLHIFLNLTGIESITINDDAVLETSSEFDTDKITIYANNSSQFDIKLDVNSSAEIIMSDNSKGKLDLRAGNIVINMEKRSDLKADLQTDDLNVVLNKSASAKLDGKATNVVFNLEGNSNLNAKKLNAQTAVLNSKNKSDIYVDASKSIEIDAEGKSTIYVYGNPDIQVKGLTDKSKIIKK
ncbi:GIN domain-containing protein [Christiangramia sabulilitoris]|uniref:DUF2807 domain-containing protein n=1 Tax=Christiangramia sabulilitoris TaxID=2583991 RepID=A0A550I0N3_9FLAO|nr:DUF2807 domain-containing protein [Christiangramia sabulilitoris]TRO64378.1 DUF2807 domain-containing protein [Christiangramia sabulilitoris]